MLEATPSSDASDGRNSHLAPSARGTVFLSVLVTAVVLGQRLALPLGSTQLPLLVPLMWVLALVGVLRGDLRVSPRLCVLFGAAISAMAVLTIVATLRGLTPSITSLALFVAIYLPSLCVATSAAAAGRAVRWFIDLMLVAGVVGIALFALQFAGVGYIDYLRSVLPARLLLDGFNTADPIVYGSSIYRSNGVVFLEPSLFSLLLGLAAAMSVTLRFRTVLLPVLLVALATTLAGNGVVVFAAAIVVIAVVGPDRGRLNAVVAPLIICSAFVLLTPLGPLFANRSTEITTSNTSSSQRLVQPYLDLMPPLASDSAIAAVGAGAGSAQRLVAAENPNSAVVTPVVAKVLYEYGVSGAAVILAFLGGLLFDRARRLAYLPGMALAYFVVNPSLQAAAIATASFVFLSTLVPTLTSGRCTPRAKRRLQGAHSRRRSH